MIKLLSLLTIWIIWIVNILLVNECPAQIHFERAHEYAFGLKWIGKVCPEKIADIGTGRTAIPHIYMKIGCSVTATDIQPINNMHFELTIDDITKTKLPANTYDMITCYSTLEHIEQSDSAVYNMLKILKPGGYLIITCPFTYKNSIENVYKLPESNVYDRTIPYICKSFGRYDLRKWYRYGCSLVDIEVYQYWSGNFWRSGEYLIPAKEVGLLEKHQLGCIALRKDMK